LTLLSRPEILCNIMSEFIPRPLHLHTLDTLIADLVSGRKIAVDENETFGLSSNRSRSALKWYQNKGEDRWSGNISQPIGEELVSAIQTDTPELLQANTGQSNSSTRRLRLVKLQAHRFAGLHRFGKPDDPPKDFTHEFSNSITLFEGRNGSGKTSLLNAIIWGLTGEILRPQRPPESAEIEFECWHQPEGEAVRAFLLTPVTPMPDASIFLPSDLLLPIDTWVELIFSDENGEILPPVRRTQSRQGNKVREHAPDFSVLGVDPIALRIGTIMPGLLPHIQIGKSPSELSQAIAKLTGLASLVTLARHAGRAKKNIEGDYTKAKEGDRENADVGYSAAKAEIQAIVAENDRLALPVPIPIPSDDTLIEETLATVEAHFENAKGDAFQAAKSILGDGFDPTDRSQRDSLEKSCTLAIDRVGDIANLPSLVRLRGLRSVTEDHLAAAEGKITEILDAGEQLRQLAQNPSLAARKRLYARVATWISDHPDPQRPEDLCVVCTNPLTHSIDPVTQMPTHQHLFEAAENAALISQTLQQWSKAAEGELATGLAPALLEELGNTLPDQPCNLIKDGVIKELFDHRAFEGALSSLKVDLEVAFDELVTKAPAWAAERDIKLPSGCHILAGKLILLDRAIRFARWRKENDTCVGQILQLVRDAASPSESGSNRTALSGKLSRLSEIVQDAKPVSDVLAKLATLKQQIANRRRAEKRLDEYRIAAYALSELMTLGDLAQRQVSQLQVTLRDKASEWRNRIYESAFPSTVHDLASTSTGPKGELHIAIKQGGLTAPAQHVVNASALRASLTGFYFAFWEHVMTQRGGLNLLLLDDPQDLLDEHNSERLASSLKQLASAGAQPIVTSYNAKFANEVAKLTGTGSVDHYSVAPCSTNQPVVRITHSVRVVCQKRDTFLGAEDNADKARDYANECRIFLENKLGCIFDDPAHSAWAAANPHPSLATYVSRLRPLVGQGSQGMFCSQGFRKFVGHAALVDNSPTLVLMNDSHHGQAHLITANRVFKLRDELAALVQLVDQMHEEAARWRRRESIGANDNLPIVLGPLAIANSPHLDLAICPDLAAFAGHSGIGESQVAVEQLSPDAFDNKVYFYLRRPNFGFAAPQGAVAIAEAEPVPVANGRLVIARRNGPTLARRVLRDHGRDELGLVAEIPDRPHRDSNVVFLPQSQVDLHQVVGILLEHGLANSTGADEAVQIDASDALTRVKVCFRVKDNSAVPLAFDGQIVLGGSLIPLDQLNEGTLVALGLNDGASVFKRTGRRLPAPLEHIRQFESIGGLGSSEVLSVGKAHGGFRQVATARSVVGVLYRE
jgi:recombinational DNA repair ATPase RecF